MTCDFAFLCDYAADRGGVINAQGVGTDALIAQSVPVTHPHLFLVAQFRVGLQDLGRKRLTLRLLDDQGRVMMDQKGEANFMQPAQGRWSISRLVMGLYMLQFHRFGTNRFEVLLEDQMMATLPLRVLSSANPGMN